MAVPNHGSGCVTKTYPITCKKCNQDVFYFSCSCGSKVFFDEIEPECLSHLCLDSEYLWNSTQSEEDILYLAAEFRKRQNLNHAKMMLAKRAYINPISVEAWMQLAEICNDDKNVKFCLEVAKSLKQQNRHVIKRLRTLKHVESSPGFMFTFFPERLWKSAPKLDPNHFQCVICELSFQCKEELTKHNRSIHIEVSTRKNISTVRCKVCLALVRKDYYSWHMWRFHGSR